MKKVMYLLATLMFPLMSFSQINYSIKGQVLTADGELPTGNVLILNPVDSSFIKGTSFFGEVFEITNIQQSEVLLKLTSSLEFKDQIIPIKHNGETVIDLGEIIVETQGIDLGAVVVTSKRPVYTQRPDGTVEVLIQNTTLAASNSVDEILSKSPEVVVDESGNLAVFGKGNAILYLNGKRITDSQLSLILPSNIKKIEIIRNPSAKYDAEGAAVINITTIKRADDGYQVSLKQNVSYSNFGGTNTYTSLNLNHRKNKFSSNAYYALQLGQERELLHTTRDRDAENVFLSSDLTTDWEYDFKNYSYYGLGTKYDINTESYLSLEYSGFLESLGGKTLSGNKIIDDFGSSFYESDIDKDELDINNSLSLNYNTTIDTLGSSLFIGGQYSNFNIDTDNFIEEKNVEENNTSLRFLKNVQDLNIDIVSGQADFTKVFKNDDVLEVGTKYSYIENDFNFDFMVSDNGSQFELDKDLSNNFLYQEHIAAGYFTFKSKLGAKTNYAIGVRSEYTKYNLELSQLAEEPIRDDYLKFFPNLSISRIFSDDYNLNFSYTSRINRPPYQRLNPVLIYQDRYTSVQGNPELKPQKVHAFEVNTKFKKVRFKIGYNYTIDPFGQTALRGDDPSSYILKRINYDEKHEFFTSLSRTFSNKWWTSTNTVNLKYTNIEENGFGFERVEPRPNLYFYTNNRFKLSNSLNAEVLFWYLGDNYEGLHHRQDMYNLSITLEKSFLDNALKCRLVANDIFHSFIASGNYNVGQTDVYYNRRWSTDYFRLSLMYNFGRLKKASYRNSAIGTSENNRVQ